MKLREMLPMMGVAGFGISIYLLLRSFKSDRQANRIEGHLKALRENVDSDLDT